MRCISFDPEKQRTPRRTIICRHDWADLRWAGHYHVGVLCEERLIRKKSISATYFEWLRLIRISLHKNWRCDNILLKTTIRSKIRKRWRKAWKYIRTIRKKSKILFLLLLYLYLFQNLLYSDSNWQDLRLIVRFDFVLYGIEVFR